MRKIRVVRSVCNTEPSSKGNHGLHAIEEFLRMSTTESSSPRDLQTYVVLGAAMEVHNTLGHGFLETVYQEALAVELGKRQIPFAREVVVPIRYKDVELACGCRLDFLCFGELIVKLKALDQLVDANMAQVLNYLKATDLHRALLINFGARSLGWKRVVWRA